VESFDKTDLTLNSHGKIARRKKKKEQQAIAKKEKKEEDNKLITRSVANDREKGKYLNAYIKKNPVGETTRGKGKKKKRGFVMH